MDGIRILRRGSELTTRLYAPRLGRKGDFDLVVEEVNTLPYFAPAWSRAPTLLYINQLAREVWWYEAAKPVAALGYAERAALPAGIPSRADGHDLGVDAVTTSGASG